MAINILSLAKPISSLSVSEVTALPHWHNASKNGKLREKKKRLEKIIMNEATPPSYLKWIEIDELVLHKLKAKPIYFKKIALCRIKNINKRNICNIQSIV